MLIKKIAWLIKATKEFLKRNLNILIFTKTDKGNITVALTIMIINLKFCTCLRIKKLTLN